MSVFFSYILLGVTLAAPIGPVNAAQLDKGIKNGFWHAWVVGVGAMIADALYMLLVYLGVVHFLEVPMVKTFLWLFGFFILVYIGVESLKGESGAITVTSRRSSPPLIRSFGSGFFMCLCNPLSIVFWLGIYGSIVAKTSAHHSSEQLLLYSAAIFIGVSLWDITMAGIASGFRKYLSERMLALISTASGICLILFGIYFGWEGVTAVLEFRSH
ncbi:LysE family transporter [Salibacterium halotolerans]|uniref:Threonine/homoserine/homoserine lactone efflux protein n=1 Tax=Salibacterium halotolerans TaxID=1884432 RepID=A0A1I5QI89_9BACI|nr:LysE family transporter [Salibacterium halotolerans]SFP45935.1 Threonine/homoserine/homoserine lactone efflux protein [Salibacterium halotolerans]